MPTWRPAAVALALAWSAAPAPGWEAARTTSPDSVEELKDFQSKVKATTTKVTPATVGLLVGAGAGSGVIVSDDGLILTAAHVIGVPDTDVIVVLADGTRVRAKSLGLNSKFDSGMAKITGKVPKTASWPGADKGKWPKADLGASKVLKKGQWVISLGHHGGPKQDRTPPLRVGRYEYTNNVEKFLRSDCTLVGGDSGGPLFDLDGRVIGIHSRIGPFIEMNMHVPVDTFKDEWDKLLAGEDIGAAPAALGADLDLDLDAPTVQKVDRGTPAGRAGMKVGDVIKTFDDHPVKTRDDLKKRLAKAKSGQEVEIEVERGGETVVLTVVLGDKSAPRPRKLDE